MTDSLTHRRVPPAVGKAARPVVPDERLLDLWVCGFDTYDIAAFFGIPESEVANRLPRIREQSRQDFPEAS